MCLVAINYLHNLTSIKFVSLFHISLISILYEQIPHSVYSPKVINQSRMLTQQHSSLVQLTLWIILTHPQIYNFSQTIVFTHNSFHSQQWCKIIPDYNIWSNTFNHDRFRQTISLCILYSYIGQQVKFFCSDYGLAITRSDPVAHPGSEIQNQSINLTISCQTWGITPQYNHNSLPEL